MSRVKRTALASAVALTTLVTAGGLTALSAGTADAASGAGGTITRTEVLQRAQTWVDEHVPYNQGGWKSDANGNYREDCSGYVSMAWHLTSSLVTQTLPSVSTAIGFSSLKPGDALDYTADHTFLFAGWTNKSSGAFTYYAESNPSDPTHGPTAANINNSSLEGWPTGDYEGLRYNKIQDDAGTQPMNDLVSVGGGDFMAIDSAGTLWKYKAPNYYGSERVQVGTGWNNMRMLIATGNSTNDILAVDTSGDVYRYTGPNYSGTARVKVGYGWDNIVMATGAGDGSGDLFAVDTSGDVYRYDAPNYYGTDRVKIGYGWTDMTQIVGVGDIEKTGYPDIVAVDDSGDVYRYSGPNYYGSQRVKVGYGWDNMTNVAAVPGNGTTNLLATDVNTKNLYLYTGPNWYGTDRIQIGTNW